MRGPIHVATEGHKLTKRTFYWRKPWMRLAEVTTMRRFDALIWAGTGVEIHVGKLLIEIVWRHNY